MICPVCKEEREDRHLQVGDDYCEFCLMADIGYGEDGGESDG